MFDSYNFSQKSPKIPEGPGVYCIFCDKNNRYYIGSTGKLRKRFNGHRTSLRAGNHRNPHISKAYSRYGERSFIFRPLEECSVEKLMESESRWMDLMLGDGEGFNIRSDPAGRPGMPSDKLLLKSRALANRRNLKEFTVISPSGEKIKSRNLSKFCRENKISASLMDAVLRGKVTHHKGWTIENRRKRYSNAWALERSYDFTSPNGTRHCGKNINKFAREMGLTGTSLTMVMNGHQSNHKGWKKTPC